MPRYEYIDHEGNAHVITARNIHGASFQVWEAEYERTESTALADCAVGTVEQADERRRAA